MPLTTTPPRPVLYIWPEFGLYIGPMPEEITRHASVTYVFGIGLDGEIKTSLDGGETWTSSRSVLFRGGCDHQCRFTASTLAYLVIEPPGTLGRVLEGRMQRRREDFFTDIGEPDECVDMLADILQSRAEPTNVIEQLELLLVGPPSDLSPRSVDPRVQQVVDYIRGNPTTQLEVNDLARQAGLSSFRLMHLFKQQTHATLRQYLCWIRMRHAVELIAQGYKISVAGPESGFSDASHFSVAYKRMLGMSPSFFFGPQSNTEVIYAGPEAQITSVSREGVA